MKNFNNVRLFREFRRYSQKFVAHKLGKSQSALSKIENSSKQPSNTIIEQLSKILEVPKEMLFSDELLILDDILKTTIFKGKASFNENNIAVILLHQLSENEKLLHKVEINQQQLRQQLSELFIMQPLK